MDIRQLKHFVALIETGTEHSAAEDQHISQPGLSSSIKRLENELGTPLFEREGRGMSPNARGNDFYPHAKRILGNLRLARAELSDTESRLIIGVGDIRASNFIAAITKEMQEHFSQIQIEFYESHYQALCSSMEKGDIDAAIVGIPLDFSSSKLLVKTLTRTQFAVFGSADHPLTKIERAIEITDLLDYPWMQNTKAPDNTPFLPQIEGVGPISRDKAKFICVDSLHMGKELLVNSHCLCHCPELAMVVELSRGRVKKLDLPIRIYNVTIAALRQKDMYSSTLDHLFSVVDKYFENTAMHLD